MARKIEPPRRDSAAIEEVSGGFSPTHQRWAERVSDEITDLVNAPPVVIPPIPDNEFEVIPDLDILAGQTEIVLASTIIGNYMETVISYARTGVDNSFGGFKVASSRTVVNQVSKTAYGIHGDFRSVTPDVTHNGSGFTIAITNDTGFTVTVRGRSRTT